MSAPARFLFDECIGKPSMEQLRQLVPAVAEFAHIRDFFDKKTPDRVWIPRMASEGGWIIITSDGGKQSKKGDKLPELCREYSITHVVLSAKLHKKKAHEKIAALLFVWEQIATLEKEAPGTRFDLRFRKNKGTQALTVVLVKNDKSTKN